MSQTWRERNKKKKTLPGGSKPLVQQLLPFVVQLLEVLCRLVKLDLRCLSLRDLVEIHPPPPPTETMNAPQVECE